MKPEDCKRCLKVDECKRCVVCNKPIDVLERSSCIVHKECRSKWHWLKRKEKL
jgi:hypothetical protein